MQIKFVALGLLFAVTQVIAASEPDGMLRPPLFPSFLLFSLILRVRSLFLRAAANVFSF